MPATPRLRPLGSLTLLCTATLTIMVGCVVVPGLPIIAAALGVPRASGWLVTLPALGVVIAGPLVGPLIRRVGARQALLSGLILYGLLGAGGAWLRVPGVLFADRVLLGGATAIVMSSGTSLIATFYEGPARLAMIARQGMAIELGGVVFLGLAGMLASWHWQAPFAIYLLAWLIAALAALSLPRLPARFATAAAPLSAHEDAGHGGLLPVYLAALMSMVLFFTAVIMLPGRLGQIGLDAARIGYFLSFVSLVAVAVASTLPRIVRRCSEPGTLALAFAFYAVAHLIFATATATSLMIAGGMLLGAGFGCSVPLVNHMTVERSRTARRDHNLAYLASMLFLGQFLSSFLDLQPGGAIAAFRAAAVVAIGLGIGFAGLHRRDSLGKASA
ncbi:MFS transporter [Solimonas marina]|uniref:MFS transporter n=1 Tax=Solimonas marina TaxID=2714601 RepID=A0A970B7D0_9GAMM|nr:MFS transporter [Solimonas marina]NKF21084.1 MFS transporter [Solimonas marina]